jgi:hypothetical protein
VQFVSFAPFVTLFGFCSCGADLGPLSLSLFFISPFAGSFVFMELVRISGFHQYEVSWAALFFFLPNLQPMYIIKNCNIAVHCTKMDWKASAMTSTNIMSRMKRVSDSQQYGSEDNTQKLKFA